MESSPVKPISEAPESNAGDDFHRLWAAKKALDLVNFDDSGLKLLSIEGSQADEAKEIDATGRKLLSIDLAEYYGGRTFGTATRVVFSQLKYSTRTPDKNYTAARLCEGKGDDKDRSIIERLADSFNGYRVNFGREAVIQKLGLKLVTNRPVENGFNLRLQDIQQYIQISQGPVNYKKLLEKFPEDQDMLTRLFNAAKLKSQEFTDFLRVLDFSDTGTGSRFFHRSRLIEKLSHADPNEFKVRFHALYVLVNDLTMPEKREKNSLTIEDIVLLFEMGRIENMFPAPPMFEKLTHPIQREQVTDLKNEIIGSAESVICLHGEGGTGKSTIVQQVLRELPAGSLAICYDCYGQGTYLNSEATRHLPQIAFTEILNELAKETGTPFLLNSDIPDYMFPRQFSEKINAAAELINASYPEAILAVVIDAADNSVTAAALRHDSCFVNELVSIGGLKPSVRLVFTCRTGRKGSLKLPELYTDITIRPFTEIETKLFVSARLSEISENELKEFHGLTGGVPRVQSYSLLNRTTIAEIFTFLKPYGHTVGTLIDSHLKESKLKFGNVELADNLLKGLIILPRPVPINYLSLLTGITETDIIDFVKDLWTGLVLTEGRISFRDEDFEDRLRGIYPADVQYYQKLADLMIIQADKDTYAAANLAGFLFHAERYEDLKEIVLTNKYLAIKDPVYKREVFIERTRLAIRSCDINEDNATFIRLLVIAAEAAKSNQAQLQIIYNNVELIVENQNLRTIQKLYYDTSSNDGYGAANWRVAAIFARGKFTAGYARQHLYQAERWLRRRAKLHEKKLGNFPISESDIASGAESVLRLDGIAASIKWLKRWQPKEMMTKVVRSMITQTLVSASDKEIANWSTGIKRADISIILAAQLIRSGKTNTVNMTALFTRIQSLIDRSFHFPPVLNTELIFLAEFYIARPEYRNTCSNILRSLTIIAPVYNTRFIGGEYGDRDDVKDLDHFFRVRALLALLDKHDLKPSELLPPEKTAADAIASGKPKRHSETDIIEKLYIRLLPVYQLRALVAMKLINAKADVKLFQGFKKFGEEWIFLYERGIDAGPLSMHVAKVLIDTVYFADDKKSILTALRPISEHIKIFKQPFMLYLARKAANFKECYKLVYEVLSDAENFLKESDLSGSEWVDFYEDCISVAQLMCDTEEALIYFDKAMNAASEVDLEAFDQIKAIRSLASALGDDTRNPQLAYNLSRYVEYSSIILSGNDDFPWMQAVWAIRKVDASSLLSIWCRWDQQDRSVDGDTQFTFWSAQLLSSLVRKEITSLQAAAMTAFYPLDYDWEDLWQSIIIESAESGSKAVSQAAAYLTEDVRFSSIGSRHIYAGKIKELFKRTGVPHLLPAYIDQVIQFRPEKNRDNSDTEPTLELRQDEVTKNRNEALDKVVSETNPSDGNAIGFALLASNYADGSPPLYSPDTFLRAIRKKAEPADFTRQLDALLTLNEDHLSYSSYRDALEDRLNEWGHKQTVKAWIEDNFGRVIANHILFFKNRFNFHEYLDVSGLHKLRELFKKSEYDLAVALKKVIPLLIDVMPAPVIYQSFAILSNLLDPVAAERTIQWMTDRWCMAIPEETGEGVWNLRLLAPDSMTANYAGFLRYQLGHPDTSVRWKAAHVLVRLVQAGDTTVISSVCSNINEKTAFPFTHTGLPFLWISSKLWLYFALDHLAKEKPESVNFQLEMIKNDLFMKTGQHLLIRKLALSIVNSIRSVSADLFTSSETAEILSFVRLPIPAPEKEELSAEDDEEDWDETGDEQELGFPFDTVETVPDYYTPLARIFKVTHQELYKSAEKAIFEILGYKAEFQNKDYIAGQDRRLRDRGSSLPTLETLKDYYEFHGLFYAADQLFLKKKATENNYYTWDEWLNNWNTSWPGTWLYRLRDDTPFENRFWVSGSTYPGWRYGISAKALDEATGLDKFGENEFVIIDHHDSKCFEGGLESCAVKTALVSRKNAAALLNAFQTIDNFNRYALPVENEDWEEKPVKKFSILPMVTEIGSLSAGVDLLDYTSLSLARVKKQPCSRFLKWSGAVISDDGRKTSANGKLIARFQNWTDFNNNLKQPSSEGTNGYRLSVDKTELLKFLEDIDHCLIVESRLSRDFTRTSFSEKEKFEHQIHNIYNRLYLIYPDGKIITTAGDFNAR
jgi:hypothetical protein